MTTSILPFNPSQTFRDDRFVEILSQVRPFSTVAGYFSVTPEGVRGWMRSGAVPCRHWRDLEKMCHDYGFPYKFEDFVEWGERSGLKRIDAITSEALDPRRLYDLRVSLMRICRKYASSREELEDAIQDALVVCCVEGVTSTSFAVRATLNKLRSNRYGNQKEQTMTDEKLITFESIPETAFGYISPMTFSEERHYLVTERLMDGLARIELLPNGLREMMLRIALGYTYEDVANDLGVTMGTVGSRVNEARRLLGLVDAPDKNRSTNTSGVTGVSWVKKAKKWTSRITVDGKVIVLGNFRSKNEAISARQAAEDLYIKPKSTYSDVLKVLKSAPPSVDFLLDKIRPTTKEQTQ